MKKMLLAFGCQNGSIVLKEIETWDLQNLAPSKSDVDISVKKVDFYFLLSLK